MEKSNPTKARIVSICTALTILGVLIVMLSGAAAASTDSVDRTLSDVNVSNGSTVTVTTTGSFNSSVNDAAIVDSISTSSGVSLSNSNVSISSATPSGTIQQVTRSSSVVAQWSGTNSVQVTYDISIPNSAAVGSTINITGDVENRDTGEVTSVGKDTITVEQPSKSVTAPGNVSIPSKYVTVTSGSGQNAGGSKKKTVSPSNLLDAGTDFQQKNISPQTLLDVGTAFQSSD